VLNDYDFVVMSVMMMVIWCNNDMAVGMMLNQDFVGSHNWRKCQKASEYKNEFHCREDTVSLGDPGIPL
jgi:hypothetical protein